MKIKYTIKPSLEEALKSLGFSYYRDYIGNIFKGGKWYGIPSRPFSPILLHNGLVHLRSIDVALEYTTVEELKTFLETHKII